MEWCVCVCVCVCVRACKCTCACVCVAMKVKEEEWLGYVVSIQHEQDQLYMVMFFFHRL